MRRREFITLLGGAAAAWPLTARAQQPAMPVIGSLNPGSAHQFAHLLANVRQGLSETGYVEGQNVAVEYRWAEGQNDRLPALAADLVRRRVDVIITSGGMVSALVAKAATATIPVVFTTGGDPVRSGLVASLNRPGGNVTGVTQLTNLLEAKRVEVLHEVVPGAPVIAMLVNPKGSEVETQVRDAQLAARTLAIQIDVFRAQSEGEIDKAIITIVHERMGALLVASDPFLSSRQEQLVALAARHRLPAIYQWREAPLAGGLMSYGTSRADAQRQMGIYAGRILKGANPSDLPVQQAVKVELVINLKTAKALDITFPLPLLARADEVIE